MAGTECSRDHSFSSGVARGQPAGVLAAGVAQTKPNSWCWEWRGTIPPDEVGDGRAAILQPGRLVAQAQLRANALVGRGAVAAWQHLALRHVLQGRGGTAGHAAAEACSLPGGTQPLPWP